VILQGDCRATLTTLAPGSVHMAVTSPPYWGLRAYLPADHPLKALEFGVQKCQVKRCVVNHQGRCFGISDIFDWTNFSFNCT
jgi:DNA modification methylase